MKIALCLEYPLAVRGGVSVLVETLFKELASRRHEIVLVSPDSSDALQAAESGRWICEHVFWNPGSNSRANARNLATQIVKTGVQLAHFHFGGNYGWGNRLPGCCPITQLAELGVPCISTVHLVVDMLNGYCGPQRSMLFKLAMLPLAWLGKMQQLRNVRVEIAVSQHDLQKLQRWYWPLRKRFAQIYHSRLREADSNTMSCEREPVILNVGHIAWRKGQLVLAQAFARIAPRHPKWTLQLAGHDGGDGIVNEIGLLEKNSGLAGRICWLGERRDALDLMRRAAIYVQPSYWEALGLALQEAMSCGCVAIGSRAGGIPELIEDGRTGLLFAPGDTAQLASRLEELINDPARRKQFGSAAAASMRQRGMTAEAMVERHLQLYESVLASR
jgi:glycosyltransferase involved in cell wall biosynthesis